jgi:ubiquinone/menaquinone biosynthesis C-methylase UbiE
MTEPADPSSNWAKFQTRNPVVQHLIDRFYQRLESTVSPLAPRSLLDAGCGEGETLTRLSAPECLVGLDVNADAVAFAARRCPRAEVLRGSVYQLPFADRSFDLVLCLEVLEHLQEPQRAVAELGRVSRRDVVVSIPHEPWFRIGSALRGKYLRNLGNHPEHVNHWDRRDLRRFLEPGLEVVGIRGSFPWLIAHCRRR